MIEGKNKRCSAGATFRDDIAPAEHRFYFSHQFGTLQVEVCCNKGEVMSVLGGLLYALGATFTPFTGALPPESAPPFVRPVQWRTEELRLPSGAMSTVTVGCILGPDIQVCWYFTADGQLIREVYWLYLGARTLRSERWRGGG